jgi:hypothetical protein
MGKVCDGLALGEGCAAAASAGAGLVGDGDGLVRGGAVGDSDGLGLGEQLSLGDGDGGPGSVGEALGDAPGAGAVLFAATSKLSPAANAARTTRDVKSLFMGSTSRMRGKRRLS